MSQEKKPNPKLVILKPTTSEEFNIDGDDSSDEENVEAVKQYDITQSYKKFNEKEDKTFDDKLSFIAHSLGLKVLYHPEVNELYRSLKNEHMILNDGYRMVEEFLSRLVQKVFVEACMSEFNFKRMTKQDLSEFLEDELAEVTSEIIKRLNPFIQKFSASKTKQLILFLKNNRDKKKLWQAACNDQEHTTKQDGELFFNNLKGILSGYLQNIVKFRKPLVPNEEHIATNYQGLMGLDDYIIHHALEIMKELFGDASITCGAMNKKLNKILPAKLGEMKKRYPFFFESIYNILIGVAGNKRVPNFLRECVQSLKIPYIRYLNYCDENNINVVSSDFSPWVLSNDIRALKHFLSFSLERLLENVVLFTIEKFAEEVKNFNLDRKVLSSTGILVSNTPFGFFAGKRLIERSQRRMIRNLSATPFHSFGYTVVYNWAFLGEEGVSVPEEQNITYSNTAKKFGRVDLVITLDTYKKILSYIHKLKTLLNSHKIPATDSEIANYIRLIFKGQLPKWMAEGILSKTEKKIIINFLSSIAYLLFGCETRRNPGLIILNQMLLDLIIAGDQNLTWEIAFETGIHERGGLMPMAPKGAVSVGRQLNSDYNNYLPRRYYYEGTEASRPDKDEEKKKKIDKEDLITYEAAIFTRWLKYHKKPPDNLSFDKLKDHLDQNMSIFEIITLVEASFETWFNVSPQQAKLVPTFRGF